MIVDLPIRTPEIGRLRMGDKEMVAGKGGRQVERPRKASTWIATCDDEATIGSMAARYGGTPERWADGEQTWRLYTETTDLDVLVPVDAFSSAYERWGSGGCQRRCDGQTATIIDVAEGAPRIVEDACWCKAQGLVPADHQSVEKGACDLSVRLKVVLPDVIGLGHWMLTTGSIYAAMELPGQVALLDGLRRAGSLVPATLVLQARTEKKAWEKYRREFCVPTLRIRRSMTELAAASRVDSVTGEIGPGTPANEERHSSRPSTISHLSPMVRSVIIACSESGLTDDDRHGLVRRITGGRTSSSRELTAPECAQVLGAVGDGSWRQLVADPAEVVETVPADPADEWDRISLSNMIDQLDDEHRSILRPMWKEAGLPAPSKVASKLQVQAALDLLGSVGKQARETYGTRRRHANAAMAKVGVKGDDARRALMRQATNDATDSSVQLTPDQLEAVLAACETLRIADETGVPVA
ncbi:MAG: recombination directionality factor [Acidimicrobiales bacterium]